MVVEVYPKMMLWQQVLSNMLHDNAVPHCKLHSVSVLFGAQYWACVGLHLLPTDKDFARLTQSLAVTKAMFHTICKICCPADKGPRL